jgi:hypothetical protein
MLLAACSSSTQPAALSLASLVGQWNVASLLWTRTDGMAGQLDFIQIGGTISVTVAGDGSVTGHGNSVLTGTFTLSGTVSVQNERVMLVLNATPSDPNAPTIDLPSDFGAVLDNDTLTLTGLNTTFDVDFSGMPDAATVVLVLERT